MRRLGDSLFERPRSTEQGGEHGQQRLRTNGYFGECDLDKKAGVHQHFIEIDDKGPGLPQCRALDSIMITQFGWSC
jgi:hypothetical protein